MAGTIKKVLIPQWDEDEKLSIKNLQIRISSGAHQPGIVFRYIVLVLGFCRKHFPGRVGTKSFPVLFALLHIFKRSHVHKVGHVAAGKHLAVKNSVKAKALKKAYLIAPVKHINLVYIQLFGSAFVAAQLVHFITYA